MESRTAVTVRLPSWPIDDARHLRAEGESFNDLVVEALQQELRRRKGLQAYAAIRRTREQVEARTGVQPDSVPLVRSWREEGSRG
jgi:hypothetical protein